jgi:predicted PilT family ATPase
MGHFDGYEIVIPKFAMRVAETLGGAKKTGISNEISKLKSLEGENKIKVMNYGEVDDDESVGKMLSHEDEKLAEISDMTNSILVTSDNLFKSNRELENRPVILIPGKIQEAIKTIHEARAS